MITLSMIVKNEEKYLTGCLDSVKDVVDEIVIIDTGSTDNTIKIAEKFGAKIFHFKWINNFSAARNFALEKSNGDWILYLDADERLNPEHKKALIQLSRKNKRTAYYCLVNSIDEIKNRPAKMKYVRFFPNHPKVRFEGAAHEQIVPSLIKNNFNLVQTNLEIIHLGYNVQHEQIREKAKRNLEILSAEYQNKKYAYCAFQIAQSYSLLDEDENAEKFYKEAISFPNLEKEYAALSYRCLSVVEAKRNNWNKAIELIERSVNLDKDQPLSLLVMSQIYQGIKDFVTAEKLCRQALIQNEKCMAGKDSSILTIMTDAKAILLYGLTLSVQGRMKDSFNFYYNKLKKNVSDLTDKIEIDFFERMINNTPIETAEMPTFISGLKKTNLDTLLTLLKEYPFISVKIEVLKQLYEVHKGNITILNSLAEIFLTESKQAEAIVLYEEIIRTEPNNPGYYFNLLSLYLQNGQTEKAFSLLTSAVKKFKDEAAVKEKLLMIREKLNSILVT